MTISGENAGPDARKTKKQLIDELKILRDHVKTLETARSMAFERELPLPEIPDARADKELHERDQLYVDILEGSPTAVVIMASGGKPLYWNSRFRELIKFDDEQIRARDMRRYYKNDADLERMRELVQRQGRAENMEIEFDVGQAESIWVMISIEPTEFEGQKAYICWSFDISDRKQAEQALRANEKQLAAILDGSPIGVAISGEDGKRKYVNTRVSEMSGRREQDLIGKDSVSNYASAATREKMRKIYAEHGHIRDFEAELVRPDGSTYWTRLAVNPIEYQGEPARVAWSYDITDRKRAEAELLESEKNLTAILDASPTAITITGPDGNRKYVNHRLAEMVGRSRKELIGSETVSSYADPAVSSRLTEQLDKKGAVRDVEVEFMRQDGEQYSVLLTMEPIQFGGELCRITWAYEITDRKRAEETLASQKSILEATMENMDQGITMFNSELKLVASNEKVREIWEFPPHLFEIGVFAGDWIRQHALNAGLETVGVSGPDELESYVAERVEMLRLGEIAQDERTLNEGKIFEIRRSPIPNGGYVSTYTDITKRKNAEQALRKQTQLVQFLHDTVTTANQAKSVEDALKVCLDAVCAYNSWPAGHVFMCRPDAPDILVSTDIWHLDEPERFDAFRRATDEITFERGVGLPGRVLESNESAWIADVAQDPSFPRAKLADNIGIKAGFAVPVLAGDEVAAVMEFFGADAVAPDASLLSVLDNIGMQIGRIIERKRAEQIIAEQHQLLQVVLDNMAQGVTLYGPDERVRLFNNQARSLLGLDKEILRVGTSFRDLVSDLQIRGTLASGSANISLTRMRAGKRSDHMQEVEVHRTDGAIIQVHRRNLDDGGFVATQTDITERKHAEETTANAMALINDSISYASRIQRSTLPEHLMLDLAFSDHFVIWEPRDVVGGDIYWLLPVKDGYVLGVADCTGHGVPGAFLTLVASSALRFSDAQTPDANPAQLISSMNYFVKDVLAQYTDDAASDDGLELGICRINSTTKSVEFAGARFSLWIVHDGETREVKGDKTGIGYIDVPIRLELKNHDIGHLDGASYCMFSDGFNDQVGGSRGRGFGKRRILDLLLRLKDRPMAAQREAILETFTEFQGDELRRDDLTMVGFQL